MIIGVTAFGFLAILAFVFGSISLNEKWLSSYLLWKNKTAGVKSNISKSTVKSNRIAGYILFTIGFLILGLIFILLFL